MKAGYTMETVVDLGRGEVEWRINGVSQFRYSMAKLKDNKIKWVPYLYLGAERDCV